MCKKKEDKDKLVSFIMGLNDSYVKIKGQLIRMKSQPSLDVHNLWFSWRNNRGISNATIEANNTTLVVHQHQKKEQTQIKYNQKEKMPNKGKEWKTKKVCDNCKKVGHLVDNCYYLKGFPSTYPLHRVFPKPVKKSMTKKKTTRSCHTDFTSRSSKRQQPSL